MDCALDYMKLLKEELKDPSDFLILKTKEMVMWMMNKRFIAENTETLYDSEKDYRYVYWKEIEPLLNEMDIENKMIKHQSIKKILHLLYWIETKIKKWGLND